MSDISDLLFWGSVTVSLNQQNGELFGFSLIRLDNSYIPIELSKDSLDFISFYQFVMKKLQEGNSLYLIDHHIYLGKFFRDGPYGEENLFVSFVDAGALSISELFVNLECKIKSELGKRKTLIKIGDFYRNEYF